MPVIVVRGLFVEGGATKIIINGQIDRRSRAPSERLA
jgi:hypothetical protein